MHENTKLIQQTPFDLQQRFGVNAVGVLGDRVREVDPIPTGFAALDAALGQGGIRRGQLSALVGTPTSGATTLALKLLATAIRSRGARDLIGNCPVVRLNIGFIIYLVLR